MTVLDASAVLAVIQDEPGAAAVVEVLDGSVMSTVNLAEVVGKLVDAGSDGGSVGHILESGGVRIEPLIAEDAILAGTLRELPQGRALSLGDRCCLALALRSEGGTVLTADRLWAALALPLTIQLIR